MAKSSSDKKTNDASAHTKENPARERVSGENLPCCYGAPVVVYIMREMDD